MYIYIDRSIITTIVRYWMSLHVIIHCYIYIYYHMLWLFHMAICYQRQSRDPTSSESVLTVGTARRETGAVTRGIPSPGRSHAAHGSVPPVFLFVHIFGYLRSSVWFEDTHCSCIYQAQTVSFEQTYVTHVCLLFSKTH